MSWGMVAVAGASLAGSALSSKKSAKAQTQAADQSAELQREQFEAVQKNLAPFLEFGSSQLPALQGVMQPLNRQQELAQYYKSPEFSMLSRQARGQQLAASEATGGLGSSSTSNALAAIAPQLGMSYLGQREAQQADLFNRLMSGAGMGLNAASMTGQAGQNYASQASQAYQQAGAARAGAAMAPFNTGMGLLGAYVGSGGTFGGSGSGTGNTQTGQGMGGFGRWSW